MKAYSLSDEACSFMSSYICDRYQRVKVSNARNSWTKLTKGIPQRSGLCLFLLNVYMHDFSYLMAICDLVNYADDIL